MTGWRIQLIALRSAAEIDRGRGLARAAARFRRLLKSMAGIRAKWTAEALRRPQRENVALERRDPSIGTAPSGRAVSGGARASYERRRGGTSGRSIFERGGLYGKLGSPYLTNRA